jgi:hypothetical protein
MKVKFYIHPDFKNDALSPAPILYPLWGVPNMKSTPYNEEFFSTYSYDTAHYELVESIATADFVLVPYRYNELLKKDVELYNNIVKFAKDAGKPVLVDGTGDIEKRIQEDHVYALRVGGYSFIKQKNDIQIPFYADDLLERYFDGKLKLRNKNEQPSVSFSAWAKVTPVQRVKWFIKEFPDRLKGLFISRYRAIKKGVLVRAKVVTVLQKNSKIATDFNIRSSYSGHKKTAEKDMKTLREEFVKNIHSNDYGLVVRGDANSSARFYEVLSLGRIPLFVDTACNLPLTDNVDYKEFCIFVDHMDIKNIDDILLKTHSQISSEKFIAMQRRAREVYEKYFRIDAFTEHLMYELKKKIDS